MSGGRPPLTVSRRIGPGPVVRRGSDAPYHSLVLVEGEPHVVRSELAPDAGTVRLGGQVRPLLAFIHITDLQLADVQSPVRFEFINRELLDPKYAGLIPTQRPQEALAPHAVDAMVRAVNEISLGPVAGGLVELVVTTGDAIDNAQWNELLAVLNLYDGGSLDLGSGGPYQGVQSPDWPDDIFWQPEGSSSGKPDVWRSRFGFPHHPDLLDAAVRPFTTTGLQLPWLACYGNHEALVQGVGTVTPELASALVGGWKPTRLPEAVGDDPYEVFVAHAERFLGSDQRRVRALESRRPITRGEFVAAHFRAGAKPEGHGFSATNVRDGTAYYAHDWGDIRFVTLDTACLAGGADGCLDEDQVRWLEDRLVEVHSSHFGAFGERVRTGNGDRLVVLLSHHGVAALTNRRGGHPGPGGTPLVGAPELVALLHRFPNVILWVNGHTHHNGIEPWPSPYGGGFWEVTTCAVADWPCQARLVELVEDGTGRLLIACTMVDHKGPVTPLSGWEAPWSSPAMAGLHREIAANVPWSGLHSAQAGRVEDRNVVLRVGDPRRLFTR